MAYIYAYARDEQECANFGLVGALFDQEAVFDLSAGEFGELTFKHPIDPYGKWAVLENDMLLKTAIPVRLVPEVDDGAYIGKVDVYHVSASATKYQRYVYYVDTASKDPTYEYEQETGETYKRGKKKGQPKMKKMQRTKHKKLLKKNTRVYVIGNPRPNDPSYRFKVRIGSGKKKVIGYMEKAGLTLDQLDKTIPETQESQEELSASYAIQDQLFRIYAIDTEMDENRVGMLTVHARRLVYDLLGNITAYKATTNVSCQTVCAGVLEHTVFPHPFTIFSDIGDKHVGIDCRNKNPIEALIDPDEGVVGHWGGEVVCDDYDIYVLRHAGKDRGVKIRYGRNMQGVKCDADYSNVMTAIRPIGETSSGAPLYLDGYYQNGENRYNHNASTTYKLPTGFRWAIDDEGNRKTSVIERDQQYDGYAVPRAYVLEVADAKVAKQHKDTDPSETSVLTTVSARAMLAQAAVDMFNAGCDVPDISMDVDFTLLGDTEEYAQYRHLEPMFVYDTVEIRHNRLGIVADEQLLSIKWDIRKERVLAATFGSMGDAVAKIPGFALSNISGGKIVPGTITGGQLAEDSVSLDHLQANSVNTKVLMAESVTADKLHAGAIDTQLLAAQEAVIQALEVGTITAGTLAAKYAEIFDVIATNIRTNFENADVFTAALASITTLTAKVADFDVETVTHLIGSVLDVTRLFNYYARIENLYVTRANLMNATMDTLTVKGSDDKYYDIGINSDGTIHATEHVLTPEEIAAGETYDGRGIVSDINLDIVGESGIDGRYIEDAESGLMTLYTQALNTGKLTAVSAFIGSATIPSLETTSIQALGDNLNLEANESINLIIGEAIDDIKLGTRNYLRNSSNLTWEGHYGFGSAINPIAVCDYAICNQAVLA